MRILYDYTQRLCALVDEHGICICVLRFEELATYALAIA